MAMNACGTYRGSEPMVTLERACRPISPIIEPSRANTSDDWGGWTICQASPVLALAGSCAPAATAASRNVRTTRIVFIYPSGRTKILIGSFPVAPAAPPGRLFDHGHRRERRGLAVPSKERRLRRQP